jgi:7-cyano-7-deazaguanine reductase
MFNLYFAGSDNPEWKQYLIKKKANRLASWLNDKNVITGWIEEKAEGKLFIDSGAFSAHTLGKEVDIDKYIEYLNNLDEHIYIAAELDKIPGVFRQAKTRKQCLEAPLISWKNYLYIRERVKSPDKILPIFHQNEDFDWLVNMLETTFDGKHIPYIGVSPANDRSTKEKNEWFETVFRLIAESSNPNVYTHAFGMTSLSVLERYPFTSADSTSWIMTGANGGIMTPYGTVIMSSKQLDNPQHINYAPEEEQIQIQQLCKKYGFNFEELMESYQQRCNFNIAYLMDWAENYTYKGTEIRKRSLIKYKPKTIEQHIEIIRKAEIMEVEKEQHLQQMQEKAQESKVTSSEILQSVVEPKQEESKAGRQGEEFGTVKGLGAKNTKYLYDYDPSQLEYFENKHPENDYVVKFNAYEFTSLCPKTGQPDFATIHIKYIPGVKMVESKSLKLYLFSFRNHGDFHEDCVNIIMKDLVKLLQPKYLEVKGLFTPRGGIAIHPLATYSNGEDKYNEIEKLRQLEELKAGF